MNPPPPHPHPHPHHHLRSVLFSLSFLCVVVGSNGVARLHGRASHFAHHVTQTVAQTIPHVTQLLWFFSFLFVLLVSMPDYIVYYSDPCYHTLLYFVYLLSFGLNIRLILPSAGTMALFISCRRRRCGSCRRRRRRLRHHR